MKRTFLLLFSLFSLVSLQAENKVSLTLIPPGKITNKVDLRWYCERKCFTTDLSGSFVLE